MKVIKDNEYIQHFPGNIHTPNEIKYRQLLGFQQENASLNLGFLSLEEEPKHQLISGSGGKGWGEYGGVWLTVDP